MIKHKGYSLAEILISVTIISIILLYAIPVITKKEKKTEIKGGYQGFYFEQETSTTNTDYIGSGVPIDLPCYETTLAGTYGEKTEVGTRKGRCQMHTFVVPPNVYAVDLTLVAGGGGGGGAGGASVTEREFTTSDSLSSVQFSQERLKNIKVNLLTGQGASGGSAYPSSRQNGAGGASGNAIFDFNIHKDHLKNNFAETFVIPGTNVSLSPSDYTNFIGLDFTNDNSNSSFGNSSTSYGKGLLLKRKHKNTNAWSNIYGLFARNYGSNLVQCFSKTSKGSVTSNNLNIIACKLTPENYTVSKAGQSRISYPSNITPAAGTILTGSDGGKIGEYIYGSGGQGQSIFYNGSSWETISNSTGAGGSAFGSATVSLEHPGGGGAGGSGGSAIKINDFPVIPGAKYKIVVGAGGSGGMKGSDGLYRFKSQTRNQDDRVTYDAITFAKEGADGAGGTSTAIYDENNNLVLMVIGGAGGLGGNIIKYDSNDWNTSLKFSEIWYPQSSGSHYHGFPYPKTKELYGNVPLVIIGSNYINSINTKNTSNNIDKNIIYSAEKADSITTINNNISVTKNNTNRLGNSETRFIKYAYLQNNSSPLYELTTGNSRVSITSNSNVSQYMRTKGLMTDGREPVYKNTNNITNKKLYTGLSIAYPINGVRAYAGGLGGHSGIGSKAGCGGLFVGNKDGRFLNNSNVESTSEEYTNTFLMNANAITKLFKIGDYYSGCSTKTSDGHTAEFVAPGVTPGIGQTFGQAGAGGGGGGWHPEYGGGSGGDGQNGYVFITWR